MCVGCGNFDIDMMRTLKSFYFWLFLIVVFFSFLCCHTNRYAVSRKRRRGVLYDVRYKACHDLMAGANNRPEPFSQRTIPSNNSIASIPGRQYENTRYRFERLVFNTFHISRKTIKGKII